MIRFTLNNSRIIFQGDQESTLLQFLRQSLRVTSVKDGCSGQSACGACMVEINGKPKLSCVTKMKTLEGSTITTMEGIPDEIRDVIANAFVEKGAVQCGFCTPGLIIRTKILFQENPDPSDGEIRQALKWNLCRCTGYVKIVEAIVFAMDALRNGNKVEISAGSGKIGTSYPKYEASQTAIGKRKFVNDLFFDDMLFASLRFSDHPRAVVKQINFSAAAKMKGVVRVFTAKDIPGDRMVGLIYKDWPMMIAEGETTRYIGDVIAGVVANDEETAKKAAAAIRIEYEVLEPICDLLEAAENKPATVHPEKSNILGRCIIRRGGNAEDALVAADYVSEGIYTTQRIEHAFLETEGAVAIPKGIGIKMFVNSQGIYVDRKQIAEMLGVSEDHIEIELMPTGGGFGGKEDMTVQGHIGLFTWLLRRPVKLILTREESIRMHPKRHPVHMKIAVGANKEGKITVVKLRAHGDTGAYASVGTKVMERVGGHATGGYHVSIVDIEANTVYTNNIPSGAMRGFGANQVAFALESCIDEICVKGGFDRWQFRYDNALIEGSMTATGQILGKGVGIRACLKALKEPFIKAKYAGIAAGIKNCGVGNGMPDFSDVKIVIEKNDKVTIHHGWTEMGQGIQNMVIQTLVEETGMNPEFVDVKITTAAEIPTGMTTSSRATVLACNAVRNAAENLRNDLKTKKLHDLIGSVYLGNFTIDWTTKPGENVDKVITHFSYGYAAQLAILNDEGELSEMVAAHDAGKIMNPVMFEGQIEGGVHMGIGYATSEDFQMEGGFPKSYKLRDCGVLRAHET
ncbi:MAG: molybdopterin-dependent oxidoreductase, partial [Bacteroidetes bacterium]|nr:molybdopterin-dependent oxidoreductase [Bacteroidota bacterium]